MSSVVSVPFARDELRFLYPDFFLSFFFFFESVALRFRDFSDRSPREIPQCARELNSAILQNSNESDMQ